MQDIICRLIRFRDERDWSKYHTGGELARAIGIEAAELNELFLWGQQPDSDKVKAEVADVLIFCINLCEIYGFDPIEIMHDKITNNEARHPVGSDFG
jgi:NTP pyrophosphatase (non-canonical NTP hydrolase)